MPRRCMEILASVEEIFHDAVAKEIRKKREYVRVARERRAGSFEIEREKARRNVQIRTEQDESVD